MSEYRSSHARSVAAGTSSIRATAPIEYTGRSPSLAKCASVECKPTVNVRVPNKFCTDIFPNRGLDVQELTNYCGSSNRASRGFHEEGVRTGGPGCVGRVGATILAYAPGCPDQAKSCIEEAGGFSWSRPLRRRAGARR